MTKDNNVPGGADDQNGEGLDGELQMPNVSRRGMLLGGAAYLLGKGAERLAGRENERGATASAEAGVQAGVDDSRSGLENAMANPELSALQGRLKNECGLDIPVETMDGGPVLNLDKASVVDKDKFERFADSDVLKAGGITEAIWVAVLVLGVGFYIAGKVMKPSPERKAETNESMKAKLTAIKKALTEANLLGDQPYQIDQAFIRRTLTRDSLDKLWERFDDDDALHDIVNDEYNRVAKILSSHPTLRTEKQREAVKGAVMGGLSTAGLALAPGDLASPANSFKIDPDDLDPTNDEATFKVALTNIATDLRAMQQNVAHPNSVAFIAAERGRINAVKPQIQRHVDQLVDLSKESVKDMGLGDMVRDGAYRQEHITRRGALLRIAGIGAGILGAAALGYKLLGGNFSSGDKKKPKGGPRPLNDATQGDGGNGGTEEELPDTNPGTAKGPKPKPKHKPKGKGKHKPRRPRTPDAEEVDPDKLKNMERLRKLRQRDGIKLDY